MILPESRLILVYNADGGWLNALKDAVWKAARPSTYPCSLCALTYGYVAMHSRWRRFLRRLPHDKVFHHRDDFAQTYPSQIFTLPAILVAQKDNPPEVLASAAEIDALPDLEALIALVATPLGIPPETLD